MIDNLFINFDNAKDNDHYLTNYKLNNTISLISVNEQKNVLHVTSPQEKKIYSLDGINHNIISFAKDKDKPHKMNVNHITGKLYISSFGGNLISNYDINDKNMNLDNVFYIGNDITDFVIDNNEFDTLNNLIFISKKNVLNNSIIISTGISDQDNPGMIEQIPEINYDQDGYTIHKSTGDILEVDRNSNRLYIFNSNNTDNKLLAFDYFVGQENNISKTISKYAYGKNFTFVTTEQMDVLFSNLAYINKINFKMTDMISYDKDNSLYVTDFYNGNIHHIDHNGKIYGNISSTYIPFPSKLALNQNNNKLYVLSGLTDMLYILDLDQNKKEKIMPRNISLPYFPSSIDINSKTNIVYITSTESNVVTILNSNSKNDDLFSLVKFNINEPRMGNLSCKFIDNNNKSENIGLDTNVLIPFNDCSLTSQNNNGYEFNYWSIDNTKNEGENLRVESQIIQNIEESSNNLDILNPFIILNPTSDHLCKINTKTINLKDLLSEFKSKSECKKEFSNLQQDLVIQANFKPSNALITHLQSIAVDLSIYALFFITLMGIIASICYRVLLKFTKYFKDKNWWQIERSELLTINSTIIIGVLVFLTLSGFEGREKEITVITSLIVIPFAISGITAIFKLSGVGTIMVFAGLINLMIAIIMLVILQL